MNFYKTIFSLVLSCVFVSSIFAQGVSFNKSSWDEILETAQKENKFIFVDAYTTWCGPCKKMSRDIFPQEKVGEVFNENFINVKMDMERGEGVALAEKYEVILYPTLLFLDGTGEIIHRAVGYHTETEFLELAEIAMDSEKSLGGMTASYDDGNRDPAFLYTYTIARFQARDGSHPAIAQEYLATQDDWSTDDNMQFIYSFVDGTDSKMFDYILENKEAFVTKFGKTEINNKIENIVLARLNDQENRPELEEVDALFAKVMGDRAAINSSAYRMTYHRQRGNREGYAAAAIAHYKAYKDDLSFDDLNETAWTFYEVVADKKSLKQAVKMSKQSIKMANNYYNNDTLASLYYKIGKKGKALKQAQKAVNIAQSNNEDHTETDKLIEEIKAM